MFIYLSILALKNYQIDLLRIYPYYEVDIRLFQIILSLIISFLVVLTIEKVHDFFTIFNCMWIIPSSFVILYFWITPKDLEKLDYVFSKEVKDFQTERIKEVVWDKSVIQIGNNRIYYSQRADWETVYNGEYRLYKSRFQNYYHLLKAE